MTKREIIIIAFFYSTLITIALVLILNNNKAGNVAEIIQAITGVFTLLLTLGTVLYAYKAFKEQKRQNDNNEKQIAQNNYDLQYNRCLDLIYRQMEVNKDTISNFQNYLEDLFDYREVKEIPKYLHKIRLVIMNYFSISHMIEQFLQRSHLHPKDKQYLYIIFYDNLPLKLKMVQTKFNSHLSELKDDEMDLKIKSTKLFYDFHKSEALKHNPNLGLVSGWFENGYKQTLDKKLESFHKDMEMIHIICGVIGDARKRLLDPNHKSISYTYKKEIKENE